MVSPETDERKLGVQVIIVRNGKVFVRPETEIKDELMLHPHGMRFVNSTGRYNAAGGGVYNGEAVLETARREMEEELGLLPDGDMQIIDMPELLCHQRRSDGRLATLRVAVAVYDASRDDVDPLRGIDGGRFIDLADAIAEIMESERLGAVSYRPTFAMALMAYEAVQERHDPAWMVRAYNGAILRYLERDVQ